MTVTYDCNKLFDEDLVLVSISVKPASRHLSSSFFLSSFPNLEHCTSKHHHDAGRHLPLRCLVWLKPGEPLHSGRVTTYRAEPKDAWLIKMEEDIG